MLFRSIVIASFAVLLQIHEISALSIAIRKRGSIIDVKVGEETLKCKLPPKRLLTADFDPWRDELCDLLEPFKGSPAVLKSIEMQPDLGAYVDGEVAYTEKVGQYLDHSFTDDDTVFNLVLKDLRKGFLNDHHQNTTTAPERKLLHEWYIADTSMDVAESLGKLRKSIYDQALYHAETHGLLYLRANLYDTFTDKTMSDTVFSNWAPSPELHTPSIEQLPEDVNAKKARMERFKQGLNEMLPKYTNMVHLRVALENYGQKLRPKDIPVWEANNAAMKKQADAENKALEEEWVRQRENESQRIKDENSEYESSDTDSGESGSDSDYYGSD